MSLPETRQKTENRPGRWWWQWWGGVAIANLGDADPWRWGAKERRGSKKTLGFWLRRWVESDVI